MVYTLVYKCFCICSWNRISHGTEFHTELTFLKGIFYKNDYRNNFVDKSFKQFLNNIYLVKESVQTVKKNVCS